MYNLSPYIHHFLARWVQPVLPIKQLSQSVSSYARYFSDWSRYSAMPGAEPWRFLDSTPALWGRTKTSSFDAHYFYQDIWVFKLIQASGTPSHVDVGSRIIFIGMLTAITKVLFIDIRPLVVNLENLNSQSSSLLALPFANNSVSSLSCLHVAEHVGLGRYGDPLDPLGTKKAAREVARVLAPNGNLYFSLPVGKQRLCFNAHRIHSPQQILDYFFDLDLVQFAGVDDNGNFKEDIDPNDLAEAEYACGLFHFTKQLSV
jgi:SAM-dependent methyltransferase